MYNAEFFGCLRMGTVSKDEIVRDYETLEIFKATLLEMLSLVHGTAGLEAYNAQYNGEIYKFADGLRVEIRQFPTGGIRVNPIAKMTTTIVSV